MKYLKIESQQGKYLTEANGFNSIDKIDKKGLMHLLDKAIEDENFEMDEYNEELVGNKAHQIIYKNIFDKLSDLLENKTKFKDESNQLFKSAFEKYSEE